MRKLGDEETDSPGLPIDGLKVGWFVVAVAGLVVPQAFAAPMIAAVIVVGGILIVHEKDQRYPSLDWSTTMRRYREQHRWPPVWTIVLFGFALTGLSMIGDGRPRGVFIVCLALYYFFWLATPQGDATAAIADDGYTE